jgi:hypothetical protein
VADKRNWRERQRQDADGSVDTQSPRVAFLPDEKQRLEGRILALKKEKEVLRAAME